MTDKPTPTEIDDLVYELRQAGKDDTYSLARAVLAKWGRPAHASKCTCTLAQRCTGSGCRYCNPQEYIDMLHEQIADARSDQATEPVGLVGCDDHCASILTGTIAHLNKHLPTGTELFTAPQPVAREPISNFHAADEFTTEPHTDDVFAAYQQGIRFAERHHCIKGGQHGTDT